jgi:ubiquinone/menaquinone biosynthesis C-methylase UbiE
MENTRQQVREFYDQVGWSQAEDGLYQNARYEDLRPVARDYIRDCRLRVRRHLAGRGDLLLDAGSGPVQWPEYLAYSAGYGHRVCADISITALKEARKRLGDHGLCVVADISHLPFKASAFDGAVSMHTIHHLPLADQRRSYVELNRVLRAGGRAVVVNGWTDPPLMRFFRPWMWLRRRLWGRFKMKESGLEDGSGTYVEKWTPRSLRRELSGAGLEYRILCWRSLSTRFLRAFIHPRLAGRAALRAVFRLEDRFPRFFGENGQYPLIAIEKSA